MAAFIVESLLVAVWTLLANRHWFLPPLGVTILRLAVTVRQVYSYLNLRSGQRAWRYNGLKLSWGFYDSVPCGYSPLVFFVFSDLTLHGPGELRKSVVSDGDECV